MENSVTAVNTPAIAAAGKRGKGFIGRRIDGFHRNGKPVSAWVRVYLLHRLNNSML